VTTGFGVRRSAFGVLVLPVLVLVLVLSVLVLVLVLAPPVFAQVRFTNAKAETRPSTTLERDVREVAARGGLTWIGYRAPMVGGQRNMCCYDMINDNTVSGGMCRLESGSGVSMAKRRETTRSTLPSTTTARRSKAMEAMAAAV